VRWQLTAIEGNLGELSASAALGPNLNDLALVPDDQGQCRITPVSDLSGRDLLWSRVKPLLDESGPNWVILPHDQRQDRDWWEGQLGDRAELGFGRAAVALSLSQMNRLAVPGRLIAADVPAEDRPGVEGVLALAWSPAEQGLNFDLARMDGRLDGDTDVGALLDLGREAQPNPEILSCPGTGSDGYLERLLPFLAHLGPWAAPTVRWEFPETRIGPMGVVGSLYSWAWLEAGYRLGDWSGPSAMLEMDESPLVGLSVVSWQAG